MFETLWKVFCRYSPARGPESKVEERSAGLNILAFYMFGTLAFFNQEMLFTASEDILSGRKLPTSTILVCFVTPLMIVKLISPWFIQKIPYIIKVMTICAFMVLGILLITLVENIQAKLFGIALNAMATGASEMVFLALTSFYPQVCISAFVAGTGMASLVAPLYYTGLTTWHCVSPKNAVLYMAPLSLLVLIFYGLMDKAPVQLGHLSASKKDLSHRDVQYKPVNGSPDGDESPSWCVRFTSNRKVKIAMKVLPFIIPLFVSFFAEYLSNSSVVTTIAFPKSHILPRDHFLYYSLAYRIGKFVGRSYLFIFACFPGMVGFLKCHKTWIFAAIELGHLIFFLFESWFHFVWYISIIIMLCSTLGLVAGMIVLHSPHAVAEKVDPDEKEFALGLVTIGNAVGAFLAGLIGLYVEPYLSKACFVHFASTTEYCVTRHGNMTGWDTNIHC